MNKTVAVILFAIVLGPVLPASEPKVEVNLVVDLTPAGRKLPPPTSKSPTYYLPIVVGYRQKGASIAGEEPPPSTVAVVHAVAKTLAAQGYRVVESSTPPPSILLTFQWGYIGPILLENANPATGRTFVNQQEMLSLVAGGTYQNLNWFSEQVVAMNAAEEDRYYLIIGAYDFAAAQEHKKKLLWTAKVSTQMGGVKLSEVLPALLTAAGPWLGRETKFPKTQMLPLAREGSVDVGVPVVVPKGK